MRFRARVRCGPTRNRGRCRGSSPRGVSPKFLCDASVGGTSKKGTESEVSEGTSETFGVKTERGTHKFVATPVSAYGLALPGRIRQRQLRQKSRGNPVGCPRRGRGDSNWGLRAVGKSRRATGEGWSLLRFLERGFFVLLDVCSLAYLLIEEFLTPACQRATQVKFVSQEECHIH